MALSTYLTFGGNCREAFEFYRSVFGGEYRVFTTFGEGPDDMRVGDDEKDRVMHVSLPVGDSVLMGSDSSSRFGPPLQVGNNFSISVAAESREHADVLHAGLSERGVAAMPMEETFWGSYFGMCTDRFGINWMVSHELEPAQ